MKDHGEYTINIGNGLLLDQETGEIRGVPIARTLSPVTLTIYSWTGYVEGKVYRWWGNHEDDDKQVDWDTDGAKTVAIATLTLA